MRLLHNPNNFVGGVKNLNTKIERRVFTMDTRSEDATKLGGHAAVFDKVADLGFFREKIAPGAFTQAIKRDDVRALFNHDPNYVLGRNTAGTLRMAEDKKGLSWEADIPDTQWAKDLQISIERGDISQCSFGFRAIKDAWDETDPVRPIRTINEVELFDVSIVTFPAYTDTDAQLRSIYDTHAAEVQGDRAKQAQIQGDEATRARQIEALKIKGGL
jgi:HK97 family phage prohead protease